jgi:hypothetical protein
MSPFVKPRRIAFLLVGLALVLGLAAALLPGIAGTAEASTRCGTEFYYYSDASLTEVVGVRGWLPEECACQFYSWGVITPYKTVQDSYC